MPSTNAVNPNVTRIVALPDEDVRDDIDKQRSPFVPKRTIPPTLQAMLWGRAAARCQFTQCNRPLSVSEVTLEDANVAEKAHIRAFSEGGPRADPIYPPNKLNDIDNLMLLCHACHHVVDQQGGSERYSVAQLRQMKQQHEDRVALVTGILPSLRSHVLTYGATVGAHSTAPVFESAPAALFPHRISADRRMISLGSQGTIHRDRDDQYWVREREQVRVQFDRKVRDRLQENDITHLSVFALAPQPLLVQLGVLLGDITSVDVYQRHRGSESWAWPESGDVLHFNTPASVGSGSVPALVVSVSAEIAPERVTQVLGTDVTLWSVAVPTPGNDIVKTRATLTVFRKAIRSVLDAIQARHGIMQPIHMFLAMPVSLAVELGRVRMPKADAPWVLYDQHVDLGGFSEAFTISEAE